MKSWLIRLQILIFILTLFSVSVYWLSLDGNFELVSEIEARELAGFPQIRFLEIKRTLWLLSRGRVEEARVIFIDQMLDRSIQNQITAAATDQFPQRLKLIRIARAVDRIMIETTYALLPDRAIPTNPKNGIFITRDRSTIFSGLPIYNRMVELAIDQRITEISTIADTYPNINVYVFYFELLENSQYNPMVSTVPNLDGGRSLDYLQSHIPENVTLGTFTLNSMQDFNEYYYHTDHHWNIRGAWKAYQGMYTMVSQNYPDISPMNDSMKFITFPDLLFLGTYARDSLYPLKPEPFEIGRVELPEFAVMTRDFPIEYDQSEQYLAGVYSKDPLVSRYAQFFGENYPYLRYVYENHATRNLLVIGTSYKIPIQPWIASHYNESYFVNLTLDRDFSMSAFLEDHRVDDIIILTDMDEILSLKNSINP